MQYYEVLFLIFVVNLSLLKCDENLTARNCIPYKDVLPHGQCFDALSKYNIYNYNMEDLNSTDRILRIVFSLVSGWKNAENHTKMIVINRQLQEHLDVCSHLPEFATNLKNITEVYKEKISLFFSCFSYDIKWILCHLTHSVCLQSHVDASVILSPPCKSTCVNDKCFALFKHVYNLMKDLRSICRASIPRLNDSRFNLNCQVLPEANNSYFERCQNKENRNILYTPYCYNYTRKDDSYVGDIGDGCVFWTEANPYVSTSVYPNLIKHFCRNPQGFATTPWCYTNMQSRAWKRCYINKCLTLAEEDENVSTRRQCVEYKSIVPNQLGYCTKYLNNKKVYVSLQEAARDNRILHRLSLFHTHKQNPHAAMRLLKLWLGPYINFGVNKFLSNLTRIVEYLMEEFSQHPILFEKFICMVRFRVCLTSSKDKSFIISWPCRSYCKEHSRVAQEIYNIVRQLRLLPSLNLRYSPDVRNNSICTILPEQNITHLERCQLIEDSNQNFTKVCYEGNGSGYIGIINVTSSGKTCQPWSINPYLNPGSYPTLKENFCRNPQGHLDKPWCYIDKSMQRWEYCDVKECSSNMIDDKELWMENVWMILTPLGVIIVLLVMAYFIKRHLKQRRKEQEPMVSPYLDFNCNKETLSNLLSPPQIETKV
ncbi:uncharacterized protein LOC130622936 isoform X1 [Hydractinia symbiolongicarpus]|uniref:uncharacterized protein LOC130622936 isoform X1 n=1 Tax=Hydractinia symbiolongicarpus TaxID=13093 RepID=UPI00254EFE6C|nr:uncharacterized protein LOC130622936 isoform X1 [Hydractinia symbiolongicarpus]